MPINTATIGGNLTRDAELRVSKAGTPVINFTIAVNNRRKNSATGVWEDDPAYIACVMFGNRAQKLAERLKKGTKAIASGKIVESRWEKDGEKRNKFQIIVDEIELPMTPRAQQPAQQPQSYGQPAPYQPDPYQPNYQQGQLTGSADYYGGGY